MSAAATLVAVVCEDCGRPSWVPGGTRCRPCFEAYQNRTTPRQPAPASREMTVPGAPRGSGRRGSDEWPTHVGKWRRQRRDAADMGRTLARIEARRAAMRARAARARSVQTTARRAEATR